MAINTNNFFKSKDVKVFPGSYRGNYNASTSTSTTTLTFDPEARLNTEYNFTHLGNANESYIINYNTAEHILYLVIGGYYFEISNINDYNLDDKYLSIETKTITLKNDDTVDSTRTTRVLKSRSGTDGDLDEEQDGEYYFTGISIENNPTGENYLKVFSGGKIYQPSLRPELKHGTGEKSIVLNNASKADGSYSYAEGYNTTAFGNRSHAEGYGTSESDVVIFAERVGESTTPYTYKYTKALGVSVGSILKVNITNTDYYLRIVSVDTIGKQISFESLTSDFPAGTLPNAMLVKGIASGPNSHAECINTTASGTGSHAEGSHTTASGWASHAEGGWTTASSSFSHAEGDNTTASGDSSHAEGSHTTASGYNSHAEGTYTTASGYGSHAEGDNTTASGRNSHAGGSSTNASKDNQTAIGKYNKEEDGEFIVGIGTSQERKNALVVNNTTTTVQNTLTVADNGTTTFTTAPNTTEIKTDINTITGTNNTITGYTTIVAKDKDNEGKETKITVDDNEIILQDTTDSSIKVNRGGTAKQVEINSTNINATALSTNTISGKDTVINGTSTAKTKINDVEKIAVNATDTTISNNTVNINGTTTTIQSDNNNKIEVTTNETKITSGKTTITNGTINKGVEINVSDQGTQINIDGDDLFSKWIKDYVLSTVYPVGSIYMSSSQDNKTVNDKKKNGCPIANLGGEWERIQGEFLYAAEVNAGVHGKDAADTTNYGINTVGGSKDAVLVIHNHSGITGADGAHSHTTSSTIYPSNILPKNLEGHLWGRAVGNFNSSTFLHSNGICSYKENDSSHKGYAVSTAGSNVASDDIKIDANHRHITTAATSHVHTIVNEGTDGVGKNMPPFRCVYMWKRIA